MRDFLPADVRKRNYVIGIIKEVYESYGFEPLETPAVENIETLLGKYGEEGNQLVFKILKRGDKLDESLAPGGNASVNERALSDLALRYDLTVPLARVVANNKNDLPKFFKRYQIQPVWRADRPARGRFREFYQCDVDCIGSGSMVVEAELISAVGEVLKRLGFADFVIRINHRDILYSILDGAGVPHEKRVDALVALDKIDKIGEVGVDKELRDRGIGDSSRARLFKFFDFFIRKESSELFNDDEKRGLLQFAENIETQERSIKRYLAEFDRVLRDRLGQVSFEEKNALIEDWLGVIDDETEKIRTRHGIEVAEFDEVVGKKEQDEFVELLGELFRKPFQFWQKLFTYFEIEKFVPPKSLGSYAAERALKLAAIFESDGDVNVEIEPSLARGLSYYTGTIIEVGLDSGDFKGSIGGGGRYDGLIGMFGKDQIPACGFSLGLERILVVMEERGMFPPEIAESTPADVMVTIWSEESVSASLKLASDLRAKGLRVTVYPDADKLGKQFKYADSIGVPFVCVLGDDEITAGTVKLKNMKTGEEFKGTVTEIAARIK